MDFFTEIKNLIVGVDSLRYLWIATIAFFVYGLPQSTQKMVFLPHALRFDVPGVFSLGFFGVCGVLVSYPFMALNQPHYGLFWLGFMIPILCLYVYLWFIYDWCGYNGEGALIMIVPLMLLLGCSVLSFVIHFFQ